VTLDVLQTFKLERLARRMWPRIATCNAFAIATFGIYSTKFVYQGHRGKAEFTGAKSEYIYYYVRG